MILEGMEGRAPGFASRDHRTDHGHGIEVYVEELKVKSNYFIRGLINSFISDHCLFHRKFGCVICVASLDSSFRCIYYFTFERNIWL